MITKYKIFDFLDSFSVVLVLNVALLLLYLICKVDEWFTYWRYERSSRRTNAQDRPLWGNVARWGTIALWRSVAGWGTII